MSTETIANNSAQEGAVEPKEVKQVPGQEVAVEEPAVDGTVENTEEPAVEQDKESAVKAAVETTMEPAAEPSVEPAAETTEQPATIGTSQKVEEPQESQETVTSTDSAANKRKSFGKQIFNWKTGDMVWAKLKGFPAWPAKILNPEALPPGLSNRVGPKGHFPVVFFGQNDYAFVPGGEIYAFESEENMASFGQMKKPPRGLMDAIRLAQEDPTSVDFVVNNEFEAVISAEGEMAYTEPLAKPKGKKRKSVADEDGDAPAAKQRKSSVGGRKARQSKSLEPVKEKTPVEVLLSLRHKLQKIFLGETVRSEDFPKVDDVMKEVEAFEETKIGKVIKRISCMKIENEPVNIVERCADLVDKWRQLLPAEINATKTTESSQVTVTEEVTMITTSQEEVSIEEQKKDEEIVVKETTVVAQEENVIASV